MLTTRSQRWRDRRARWVPAAGEIDPKRLAVDVIDTRKIAAPFVKAHHYAGTMPVTRKRGRQAALRQRWYAMMAARYVGRSSPRTDLLMPDGRPISSRALSKIRNAECGQRYAIDDLLRAGAIPPMHGENRAAQLAGLERTGFLRRRRHPGCHTYLFPLTRAARHAAAGMPDHPYPALDRTLIDGDVTALPLLHRAA